MSRQAVSPPQRLKQLEAVHLRHHQVEQDHAGPAIAPERAEALAAVGRLDDRPALLLQHAPQHLARRGVVLDHQDPRPTARPPVAA